MFTHWIKKILPNLKATQICVAFFIIIFAINTISQAVPKKNSLIKKKFSDLKKQVTLLMVNKQRPAAITKITAAESEANAPEIRGQILSIKENILSLFLNQESQDLFESSSSQMLQNIRLAEKNILHCLELEPENLYCRWQYLRILNTKGDPQFRSQADAFLLDTKNLPIFGKLAVTLVVSRLPESTLDAQEENSVLFYIYEFERSIEVQNYSRSKEALKKLTDLAPDYPDLVFMRSLLAEASQETSNDQNYKALLDIYKKNCASLRPELTRKYFYDINLCHRGL